MKQNLFEVKISDEKPEFVFPNRALRLVRIQSVDTITKTKDGYIVRGYCRRYRQYKWSDKTYRYTAIIKEKEIDYTWTLMERFESIQQLKKGK